MTNAWGDIWDFDRRSWEDLLEPSERVGGPSPWGNSKYGELERCMWRYCFFHIKRLAEETVSLPLEIGGLFHECRARAYNAHLAGMEDEYTQEELDETFVEEIFSLVDRVQDYVPNVANEVRRLLRGWLAAHGPGKPGDDRHETLLVEPLIEVDRGFPYSTRLDRVVLSEQYKGPVIMEIKTASRFSESLLKGYNIDPQFIGQQYCWHHSEYRKKYGPLKAFIVDLSIKGAQPSFPRQIVPINPAAMRDWEKEKRFTWAQFKVAEAAGFYPRNRHSCVMYGKRCEIHDACERPGPVRNKYPGFRKKKRGEY